MSHFQRLIHPLPLTVVANTPISGNRTRFWPRPAWIAELEFPALAAHFHQFVTFKRAPLSSGALHALTPKTCGS